MRRLATDGALRSTLGSAARQYWQQQHSLEHSLADYHRAIAHALEHEIPRPALPPHLTNAGDRTLRSVLERCGVPVPLEYTFADSTER
jgi:hypothetical protein